MGKKDLDLLKAALFTPDMPREQWMALPTDVFGEAPAKTVEVGGVSLAPWWDKTDADPCTLIDCLNGCTGCDKTLGIDTSAAMSTEEIEEVVAWAEEIAQRIDRCEHAANGLHSMQDRPDDPGQWCTACGKTEL